jgi:flagellar assembly factor FliW
MMMVDAISMEAQKTTTVDFPRFGEFTFAEDEVLSFPWGLPGFPTQTRWIALNLESQQGIVWLQSLDDVKVAIPTMNPWLVFEDYDPKLPPYAFATLDIRDAGEFAVLSVVVATANAEEMTMNLMAPIVVNLRTRKGRQIMLDNSPYSVRESIPRTGQAGAVRSAAS